MLVREDERRVSCTEKLLCVYHTNWCDRQTNENKLYNTSNKLIIVLLNFVHSISYTLTYFYCYTATKEEQLQEKLNTSKRMSRVEILRLEEELQAAKMNVASLSGHLEWKQRELEGEINTNCNVRH